LYVPFVFFCTHITHCQELQTKEAEAAPEGAESQKEPTPSINLSINGQGLDSMPLASYLQEGISFLRREYPQAANTLGFGSVPPTKRPARFGRAKTAAKAALQDERDQVLKFDRASYLVSL
jgi:hypothetical protein